MRLLHLSARIAAFQMQVETSQRKSDGNGFGVRIGVLGCIRIHDKLMDERWIRVGHTGYFFQHREDASADLNRCSDKDRRD